MKKKFEHKESRGLPGGPNEMFTYVTGVFDIYQAPSNIEGQGMFAGKPFKKGDLIGLAHSNGQPASQLGRMHNHNENSPTMISKKSGNDRFVFAAKDLQPGDELTTNYRMQPELEQPEDFQFGGSVMMPPRKGVRKNPDGSESTHLMATETLDGKNWFSFPTLFQDPDGTWIDMSDKPWKEAYEEAKRRGEVIEFGTDKEAAIKFGEGSWKLPKAQEGNGEVPLNRSEIFNIPRTMGYENGEMVLQDKPIWDGMLDEVTITPYTQSKLYGEYMMANKATGGLEPVYPIFDIMTLGLKAPVTAGAKAVQAGIKKAPSKINPRYFQPNSNMYYRGIGREGMEDALESGLFRAKPSDKIPARMVDLGPNLGKVDMAKRFNKTYYSPRFNTADQYGAGYIAEVPKDAAKFTQRYQNTDWSMFTRDQIPVSEGRILEKNWWSGYKPIKAYGGSLPKAQDGGEETSWTDYINPYNWGVTDRDDDGTFNQAFRAARNAGEDEFMWYGTRYNTELAPTPEKPKEEKLFYNKDILKGLSEEQTARRQSLLNAANTVASAQGDNDNLRKLLVMSAVMENTLGADPKAYGRDYTRSPMSIDDIAYDDLFNLREGARDYTAQQKKNASWLEGLGINPSDVDSLLRADDPMASMAVARLVYGRAPEALPSGDDPDALYNYYLKYYNKGGVDKYGGAEAHRKKFNDYYNQIYREFGGETDQLKIYKDYVYGVYDGTEMQSKAEKVYDKLNRVFYKEAKQSGTTVPNYILTKIMKQSDN